MKKKKVPKKFRHLRSQTLAVLAQRKFHEPKRDKYRAICPPEKGRTGPIYTSVAYHFKDAEQAAAIFAGTKQGYAYPRLSCGTPPIHALSKKLLELELGRKEARSENWDVLLTASGMSASMLLALTLADQGGSFISSPRMYGGTYHLFEEFLPRLGITCYMVEDPQDLDEWERACQAHPEAKFLFAEDDANPTPIKLDNAAIAKIAHTYGKMYICDRTVGTPILEQPLLTGADVVFHSLSKGIGGYSAGLGGALIGRADIIRQIRDTWFVVMGPVMDPRVADYLLWGMRDLKQRIRTKVANAKTVHAFLSKHAKVKRVHWTGTDLMAFEIGGTLEDARRVVESYKLIYFLPHLGDIRTLSTHPASTTHSKVPKEEREKLGISDTLVRLSVGLEDPRDLIDDLKQALKKVK